MPGEGDALLHVALYAAGALGILSLLLMLQVLVVTQASTRRQRRRNTFQARLRPLLAAEALGIGEPGLEAPAQERERRWWLETWNQMQATMRGASHARLNRLLCALAMDRHAMALLARRDMRSRLLALACFRELGDPGYWPQLLPHLRDRNPIKSLAAADALVAIDPGRAMRHLLPEAMRRRDWAHGRLAWLCHRAGQAALTPPLLELLASRPSEAPLARLLALLPYADARALAPWARRRLADTVRMPGPAERAGALQVLRALGDPGDRDRIVAAMRDPEPDVRLAAVAALRAQATLEDIPAILPMLADRSWAVRQEAATTMATLPGATPALLDLLAAEVMDRYGREALQRAIAEARP